MSSRATPAVAGSADRQTAQQSPQPPPTHRGRPAGRLCNGAGPLVPAPCPVLSCPAGAARGARAGPGDRGGGRPRAGGVWGWAGGGGRGGGWSPDPVLSSRGGREDRGPLTPSRGRGSQGAPSPVLVAQGFVFLVAAAGA